MSGTPDSAKRVPKALGTDPQLLGTYSLTDLAVAGLPGVVVILVTQVVLPPSLSIYGVPVSTLTLPLAAVAIWGYRRWAKRTHLEDFRTQLLQ